MVATVIIWLAFSITTGVLLTTPTGAIANAEGPTVFGIVLVMAVAALVFTAAVWKGTDSPSHSKAKRRGGSRIERLVESLDDDEVYDLEALLLARDEQARERRQGGG